MSFRLEQGLCPCGRRLTGVLDASGGDAQPEPGDYTICAYCERILVFGPELSVRPLTSEELAGIHVVNRTELMQALVRIRAAKG